MKHETTLTKRLGQVGYFFGRLSSRCCFSLGSPSYPGYQYSIGCCFLIVACVVLIVIGWRQYRYERLTADLEEL